jgi:thiamine pyrophosphate-dependent acetolactate synthase large subunit-like protein
VWGSDAIAATLRALDIPYLALNPGASYRGLHDSLVNRLGNHAPQMLVCLHEENAVALAHGYAKVSDRLMGAVLHSNVGLMHATMAVFNAWCDRAPVLLLGATGPWDAARRRPWIDWIHTASDQGALVRDYTKWDNQPGSVAAAQEALLRAHQIALTAPRGPTYVNLDAALQEAELDALPPLADVHRHAAPPAVAPAPAELARAIEWLDGARNPVILAGRGSRSEAAWAQRVALAEALQARVITDLKIAAAFPTDHPLHIGPPGHFLAPAVAQALREADLVLALDWLDLGGTLRQAWGAAPVSARVLHVSPDAHLHRGWSHDYQALPPADLYLMCEPDAALALLAPAVRRRAPRAPAPAAPAPAAPAAASLSGGDTLGLAALAAAFDEATRGLEVCLTRLPLGWNGAWRHFRHPLDYIGLEGGAGIGAGPGLTVGAALALRGSGRVPVGIVGDGDFLMGNTALWTAAHYGIGCLLVVANNRSYYNDEVHQERVARERGRPVENKWIGQRISEPEIDLAQMARSMGALGIGPLTRAGELPDALARGLAAAAEGRVALLDVRVQPGYEGNPSGQPAGAARD